MKCIESVVDEIYNGCKIPFQLLIDELGEYTSVGFDIIQDKCEKVFNYNNAKCCIKVNAAFSVTLDLLEFCIKEKLKEVLLNKENIISSLVEGNVLDEAIIKASLPVITSNFNLLNIYIENYDDEIFTYLKQGYLNSNIEIIFYKKNILMFGKFEDILEHAISIKETIESIVSGRCYISYYELMNYSEFQKGYKDTLYKLKLAKKYNMTEGIFDAKKLILEEIIDSVSEEMKEEIYSKFKEGISKFDGEMIRTIEVFFRCGLNISDAAKELYIHRNTLIYRLDKIQKYTEYDIRDFNNAILIKIIFFIWKEKKQLYN